MGLVQRDGIERLTHVKKYSRFKSTICVALSDAGFKAGHGRCWGVPATEIAEHSELVVVWGTQPRPHPRQHDDPHRPRPKRARGEAGGGRPLPLGHRRAGRPASAVAAGHRRRARLRRHARPVQGGLCRPRLPRPLQRRAGRAGASPARPHPGLGLGDHRPARGRDHRLRAPVGRHQAAPSCGSATASPGRGTAPPPCTPPPACRWSPAPGSTPAAGHCTISATCTVGTRR